MLCQNETGVLPGSELFFSTIGSTTRRLFYYINSCGHYYCERGYKIRRGSIGNLLLMYIEAGTMHVEYDGHSYDAHAGDIILMDCTLPQYYGTPDYVEFFWMHILGVNSFELCEYLTRARGVVHRTASNEKNAVLIRRLLAEFKNDQPVPDSERSSVLHTIFCNLMPDANKQESAQSETPAHTAARFIESHLSEPLSLQRYDLAELTRGILKDWVPVWEEAGLHYAIELPEQYTPVKLDREGYARILNNLLGNVLSHSEATELKVLLCVQDGKALVSVKDNGVGIAPQDLPHIFERLYTADRSRRRGSGLGLEIAKKLTERMGGRISVSSIPRKETSFTVCWPLDSGR